MTLPQGTGFEWVTSLHNYRSIETGKMVSRAMVTNGLEAMMDTSAVNMNTLTQSLIDGKISLASWQSSMMTEIKNTHVASAALANGGWENMTQSDWGATGQLIREQYDYLRDYAKAIADGTQALDGRALVRSDLYADAANGTYWEIDKRSHIIDGYDMARRLLEANDGNNCDGCLEAAAEGWVPIDEVLPIGDAECMTRCRCEIEYGMSSDESGDIVTEADAAQYQDLQQYAQSDSGFYDEVRSPSPQDEFNPADTQSVNVNESGMPSRETLPLRDFEDAIAGQSYETAGVYDSDGNLLFQKDGNENSVSFTREEAELMRGNINTHNHPGRDDWQGQGGSFSFDDVSLFNRYGIQEMHAVDNFYTYVIARTEDTVDKNVSRALYNKIVKEEISNARNTTLPELSHSIMARFTERYNINYKRIPK